MSTRPRILYLDGLRFVAILEVILFHYFSRWAPPLASESLYPYGSFFSAPFIHGGSGVLLFFIVSGFVIALTLYNCSTPLEFCIRRAARLWPSMLLCCVITIALLRVIPGAPFHISWLAFIPSALFFDPELLNRAMHTSVFGWADGAYWSLFVEVRFYLLAALVFFLQRERFLHNAYHFGRLLLALWLGCQLLRLNSAVSLLDVLFVANYLPWFLFGIAFYFREHSSLAPPELRQGLFLTSIFALVAHAALVRSLADFLLALLIPALFFAAGHFAILTRLLSAPSFAAIGAASYSLYLLHQNLGVAFINWSSNALNFRGPLSVVLALLAALLVTICALVIYRYWETPLNHLLVSYSLSRLRRTDLRREEAAASSASSHSVTQPEESNAA